MSDVLTAPLPQGFAAATPQATIELSVLMPCLNEARTVEDCVRTARACLAASGIVGEVVVADNGSTDGSVDLARAAGARVVHVPERGYGAALIAGIHAARGRFVIMADADSSYDFAQLGVFLSELRRGAELVMGNRFAGGISRGAMPPLHKYLGNPVLSGIGRLFFRTPIRDFHCGMRGFNRESILRLDMRTTGMEFASEMIVKATLQGLRICEVPTTLKPDGRDRPPHLRSWRDGWRHLRFLLVHAPAWLFMWPGLLCFTVGALGVAAIGLAPVRILDGVVLDIHSMLYASAAATLGFQMILLAGLSSFHALSTGVLLRLPPGVGWVRAVTLERGLVAGALLVVAGMALAVVGLSAWVGVDFASLDPRSVMRLAIPSCMLLAMGGEAMLAAFMFEVLRIHR